MSTPLELLIHDVVVAANHLSNAMLDAGCDPLIQEDSRMVEARFGRTVAEVWMAWRAIRNLAEYYHPRV